MKNKNNQPTKKQIAKIRESFTSDILALADKHHFEVYKFMHILLYFLTVYSGVILKSPKPFPNIVLQNTAIINKKLLEIEKEIASNYDKQEKQETKK